MATVVAGEEHPRLTELHERQAAIRVRLNEINAEYAGEALPDESRSEWNGLNEEMESNEKLIQELEARFQRIHEITAEPERTERSGSFNVISKRRDADIYDLAEIRTQANNPDDEVRKLRTNAMHAIERATLPHPEVEEGRAKGHVERLLQYTQEAVPGDVARRILQTGSPTYRQAFGKSLVGKPLSNEERASLSTAGSGGGFAVPFALDPTLIPTSNLVVNPARALARTVTISGSNTWQGVTSPSVTATYIAEATEVADASPTLVQPSAQVQKAHTMVTYSLEIGEDWGALESEMARMIQDGKDELEGAQFVTGVGTTVFPQGFVTGTTNTVAASTGLTVTAANLYALEAALPPRFRPNESFVANRGIYNVVRAIDTAGGAALWLYVSQGLVTQAPTPGNTGATLLGRGAWEASGMQATVVNATKIMIVGDFNYFLIVDRIGMNVELIPHIFGAANRLPIGQRGLYAYWRNTSKVLSANAFVALTGTT